VVPPRDGIARAQVRGRVALAVGVASPAPEITHRPLKLHIQHRRTYRCLVSADTDVHGSGSDNLVHDLGLVGRPAWLAIIVITRNTKERSARPLVHDHRGVVVRSAEERGQSTIGGGVKPEPGILGGGAPIHESARPDDAARRTSRRRHGGRVHRDWRIGGDHDGITALVARHLRRGRQCSRKPRAIGNDGEKCRTEARNRCVCLHGVVLSHPHRNSGRSPWANL